MIKLNLEKKFIFLNENITTSFYFIFFKKNNILNVKLDGDRFINLSMYINPYVFIAPQYFTIKQKTDYKILISKSKTQIIKVNRLVNIKNEIIPIIKFIPQISLHFFNILEVLHKFNIISKKKENILEISRSPIFFEAVNYYEKKCKKKLSNYQTSLYSKYLYLDPDKLETEIKLYKQVTKANINVENDYLKIDVSKKYDRNFNNIFLNLSNDIRLFKEDFIEFADIQLYFIQFLLGVLQVKQHGNIILIVNSITSKAIADIILIGKKIFKEVHLYQPKIHTKFKKNGTIIIFKNFIELKNKLKTELFKIYETLIKYDPTSQKFNIKKYDKEYEPYIYKKIKCPIDKNFNYKYINGFLDLDSKSPEYNFIREFNEVRYWESIQFVNKLIELKEMGGDTPKQKEKIAQYRKEQLIASVLWAKEFDMEIMPFSETGDFKDDFGKMILRDMFSYHNCIDFTFRKSKTTTQQMIPIPEEFWKLANKFNMTLFMIDTRDISLWDEIKHKIRYYKADRGKHGGKGIQLMDYLADNFDIGSEKISQGWIKMYEMHQLYSLIDKREKEIKTFHFCEAPGNFIKATEYFIKTKSKQKTKTNFNWMAQSLNPKSKKNIKKYGKSIFGDGYGLLKKYPERWNWGADGTGDILNPENIKYYKKYCEGIDLITSDCGLGWKDGDDTLLKIEIAQILAILYNLPKGANFIGKFVLPIKSPLLVSLIYILYEAFGKLIFYKSVQNQYSGEFYIIGKKYSPVDKEILNKLLELLKMKESNSNLGNNINTNLDLYKEYPEEFIYQLISSIDRMVENLTFHIDRQLYYVDNIKQISEEHMEMVKNYITEKNIDWVKKFKFK